MHCHRHKEADMNAVFIDSHPCPRADDTTCNACICEAECRSGRTFRWTVLMGPCHCSGSRCSMPSFLKLTAPPAATTNIKHDTANPSFACRVLKCALPWMICRHRGCQYCDALQDQARLGLGSCKTSRRQPSPCWPQSQ